MRSAGRVGVRHGDRSDHLGRGDARAGSLGSRSARSARQRCRP
ncbi:hypothetical protein AZ78_2757 [Lysobacter capsici AZ78]|uniref:Uncharacterized protein n=1 Tax=Lysobacter capsici AZ78 TaxID=1444315 RepID=A0A108U9V6_9GAMM|nr:hypothetical protein AZ78_2757 [Lysobacter capsici AZ78]